MTFAEYLIGRSGLPSGTATLIEHLEAIEGTGGGGDVYINSELVKIAQNDVILLEQVDGIVEIISQQSNIIGAIDDTVEIIQVEDKINVVCEI